MSRVFKLYSIILRQGYTLSTALQACHFYNENVVTVLYCICNNTIPEMLV
jgi:hypothetical protein